MVLPPLVIDVDFEREGSRRFRLWLPVFLLWPLLLPLVAFVLLVTVLTDFVLVVVGARYHHFTALFLGVLGLMGELRGTKAHVVGPDADVHVVII